MGVHAALHGSRARFSRGMGGVFFDGIEQGTIFPVPPLLPAPGLLFCSVRIVPYRGTWLACRGGRRRGKGEGEKETPL